MIMTCNNRMIQLVVLALATAMKSSAFVAHSSRATTGTPRISTRQQPKHTTTQIHGFFQDLFQPKKASGSSSPPVVFEPVVIDPDFRVAGLFLGTGILLDTLPYLQVSLGPIVTLLGVLFFVQANRIRFRFDETSLELVARQTPNKNDDDDDNDNDVAPGENIIVGGTNRWDTRSIVNYDFFPQSWMANEKHPIGPILVYFKETQTPESKWKEGPGEWANKEESIAAGTAVPGQVHFFPAVCNAQQIKAEFEKRKCGKL